VTPPPDDVRVDADLAEMAGAGDAGPRDEAGVFSLLDAIAAPDDDPPEPGGASDAAPAAGAGDERRYVLLAVAGATYAVLQASVSELDRVPGITLVPNVPAWVRGITNRRGDILSVVDVRTLLGLERLGADSGRMLVVRLADDSCALGLLVDDVPQIVTVAPGDVRQTGPGLEGPLAPFLSGVFDLAERTVAVLDVDLLLCSALIRQFDDPADVTPGR